MRSVKVFFFLFKIPSEKEKSLQLVKKCGVSGINTCPFLFCFVLLVAWFVRAKGLSGPNPLIFDFFQFQIGPV